MLEHTALTRVGEASKTNPRDDKDAVPLQTAAVQQPQSEVSGVHLEGIFVDYSPGDSHRGCKSLH